MTDLPRSKKTLTVQCRLNGKLNVSEIQLHPLCWRKQNEWYHKANWIRFTKISHLYSGNLRGYADNRAVSVRGWGAWGKNKLKPIYLPCVSKVKKSLWNRLLKNRNKKEEKNLSIGRTFKSLHDEQEDDSGEGKILRGVAAGNGNRLHIERG
jgi:hypothetical protein